MNPARAQEIVEVAKCVLVSKLKELQPKGGEDSFDILDDCADGILDIIHCILNEKENGVDLKKEYNLDIKYVEAIRDDLIKFTDN